LLLDPDLNPIWRFGSVGRRCIRLHTQVHYAPTGRFVFLASRVTDIGPPGGPECKRAWPDPRFISDPRSKIHVDPATSVSIRIKIQNPLGSWPQRGQNAKGHDRISALDRSSKSENTYGPGISVSTCSKIQIPMGSWPQRGQNAKGRGHTSVLFRSPKSKNTHGPRHIGFNLD
jgi:hypothetical protein